MGSFIGAVLGVLYAPKSGKETREDICRSTSDLYETTKKQYDQTTVKLEKLLNREKDSLMEKKERLKKAIKAGVGTFKEEQSEVSTEV